MTGAAEAGDSIQRDNIQIAVPFRDIVGHRRLLDLLARSACRGTLPQSLIFAGPDGVGKRAVALATAQALNCGSPNTPEVEGSSGVDACGVCPTCKRIARGTHPDVLLVEPGDSGSIRIEQVRDVVDRVGYRPFEGRRRVVIIDDADALVVAAQNALLKTLEEPPASSVFILVTPRADVLLPTVRSRCPRLRFQPLTADEISAVLIRLGWSAGEAAAVSTIADGSVGRALEATARDGVEARDRALRLLGVAATADLGRRLDAAKESLAQSAGAGDRDQLAVALRAMASLLRDVALLATGADGRTLVNKDIRPALERLTVYGGERGIRAFSTIDRALAALDRNAGVKIVADWVALQL